MNYWNSLVTYSEVGAQKIGSWYSTANEMFDSVVNVGAIGTFDHLKRYWVSLFLVIRYAALYNRFHFKEFDNTYYDFIQKHLDICDKMAALLARNKLSHRLIQTSEAHMYFMHTLLLRDIRKQVEQTRNPDAATLYRMDRTGTLRKESDDGFVDIQGVCPMLGEMVCYGFITMYYVNMMMTAISQQKHIAASECFKRIRTYFAYYMEKQAQVLSCASEYMRQNKRLLYDYFCFDMSEFSFVDKSVYNTINVSSTDLFRVYITNFMLANDNYVGDIDRAQEEGKLVDVDGVFPYLFLEDLKIIK